MRKERFCLKFILFELLGLEGKIVINRFDMVVKIKFIIIIFLWLNLKKKKRIRG